MLGTHKLENIIYSTKTIEDMWGLGYEDVLSTPIGAITKFIKEASIDWNL